MKQRMCHGQSDLNGHRCPFLSEVYPRHPSISSIPRLHLNSHLNVPSLKCYKPPPHTTQRNNLHLYYRVLSCSSALILSFPSQLLLSLSRSTRQKRCANSPPYPEHRPSNCPFAPLGTRSARIRPAEMSGGAARRASRDIRIGVCMV